MLRQISLSFIIVLYCFVKLIVGYSRIIQITFTVFVVKLLLQRRIYQPRKHLNRNNFQISVSPLNGMLELCVETVEEYYRIRLEVKKNIGKFLSIVLQQMNKSRYWLLLFRLKDSKNKNKELQYKKVVSVTHPLLHSVGVPYPLSTY